MATAAVPKGGGWGWVDIPVGTGGSGPVAGRMGSGFVGAGEGVTMSSGLVTLAM